MSNETPQRSVETAASGASNLKRKRSPSTSSDTLLVAAANKANKPNTTSFSINYLARKSSNDLALIHKNQTIPNLLFLLSQYSNVLDRHESLASNLGARPLGPILIKRFERCFDAPPKIVATHNIKLANAPNGEPDASATQVTWLEVIEFARSHPAQFELSTFSEGLRVCQFYHPQKQVRIQISEEDFLFINSGRCQELIPPLPIWEDEEQELSTCDVLESKLKELTNAADMVAARTRQLSHRVKGRRAAILERRAEGGSGTPAKANALQTSTTSTTLSTDSASAPSAAQSSIAESSASKRNELLRHFESLPQNHQHVSSVHSTEDQRGDALHSITRNESPLTASANTGTSVMSGRREPRDTNHDAVVTSKTPTDFKAMGSTMSLAPPSTAKHNFSKPLSTALENSQPFRTLCQLNMENLPRGHRILPPCDRCRRLKMDCLKNLTSCAGCTKKHTRCHWRDVVREELTTIDTQLEATKPRSASRDTLESPHDETRDDSVPLAVTNNDNNDHNHDHDTYDSDPSRSVEALQDQDEPSHDDHEPSPQSEGQLYADGATSSKRPSEAFAGASMTKSGTAAVSGKLNGVRSDVTSHALQLGSPDNTTSPAFISTDDSSKSVKSAFLADSGSDDNAARSIGGFRAVNETIV